MCLNIFKMARNISLLFAVLNSVVLPHRGGVVAAFVTTSTVRGSFRRRPSILANEREPGGNGEYDPRDELGRQIRGLRSDGRMEPGDTVVCTREIPSLGIYPNVGYELRSVYAQVFQESTQTMERIPLESLESDVPRGYDRYISLFSPKCHEEPVVVTPEEVGLISVRRELGDAAWLGLGGFFWVFVAFTFYSNYHERTGGSVVDAFLGR